MNQGEDKTDNESGEHFKEVPRLLFPEMTKSIKADDAGVQEAGLLGNDWSEDKIKQNAKLNEYERSEKFKNHFERIVIYALWGVVGIIALMFLVWILHLILPEKCHWLSKQQTDYLQTILVGSVSGVISTIAAKHLKKRLD